MALNAQAHLHSGNRIRRFLYSTKQFLIGGVFKSSADGAQCVNLLLTLKLLEWI